MWYVWTSGAPVARAIRRASAKVLNSHWEWTTSGPQAVSACRAAAASGVLPLWAVLLLGAAGILVLNAACGALLPPERPPQTAVRPRSVPLQVVRGGRAA